MIGSGARMRAPLLFEIWYSFNFSFIIKVVFTNEFMMAAKKSTTHKKSSTSKKGGGGIILLSMIGAALAAGAGYYATHKEEVDREAKKHMDRLAKLYKEKRPEVERRVQEVWGEVSDEAVATYLDVRGAVLHALEEENLEKTGKMLRKEYENLVEMAVKQARKSGLLDKDIEKKLEKLFKMDWKEIQKVLEKSAKNVAGVAKKEVKKVVKDVKKATKKRPAAKKKATSKKRTPAQKAAPKKRTATKKTSRKPAAKKKAPARKTTRKKK